VELPASLFDPLQDLGKVATELGIVGKDTNRLLQVDWADLLQLAPDGHPTSSRLRRHAIDEETEVVDLFGLAPTIIPSTPRSHAGRGQLITSLVVKRAFSLSLRQVPNDQLSGLRRRKGVTLGGPFFKRCHRNADGLCDRRGAGSSAGAKRRVYNDPIRSPERLTPDQRWC
jgi:hypothetical protein